MRLFKYTLQEKIEREKSPVPGGIWTHYLNIPAATQPLCSLSKMTSKHFFAIQRWHFGLILHDHSQLNHNVGSELALHQPSWLFHQGSNQDQSLRQVPTDRCGGLKSSICKAWVSMSTDYIKATCRWLQGCHQIWLWSFWVISIRQNDSYLMDSKYFLVMFPKTAQFCADFSEYGTAKNLSRFFLFFFIVVTSPFQWWRLL